jgi:selenide,water dikinase
VYAWEGGPALVQTIDFFTPIVDDPFTYGQIAAANALSDVYAMGGRPLTALAVAGFPEQVLDEDTIRQVFAGGYAKLAEAGVALLGGHTVRDPEVKFGYAITGAIDAARIWSNAGARPGDVLLLTKPLGTGIVGTAIKNDRAPAALVEAAVASMTTLNRRASEILASLDGAVHACTDITGFGLMGHATLVARASGVSLAFSAGAIPLFDGVLVIAAANRSAGMKSNREAFEAGVWAERIAPALMDVVYDPQTSGGLLAALHPEWAGRADDAMRAAGLLSAIVGRVGPRGPHAITIEM